MVPQLSSMKVMYLVGSEGTPSPGSSENRGLQGMERVRKSSTKCGSEGTPSPHEIIVVNV